MNIYVVNYIGISGALDLYEKNRSFIYKRFPRFFIKQIEDLKSLNTDIQGIDGIKQCLEKNIKCAYVSEINKGGIFRALWEGCEAIGCGCNVFIDDIPIKQEVVEIAELFGENPYEIDSSESLLVFYDGGILAAPDDIVKEIRIQSNPAVLSGTKVSVTNEMIKTEKHHPMVYAKIGTTNASKDRILIKGNIRRFLTPPKRQIKDINNRKK